MSTLHELIGQVLRRLEIPGAVVLLDSACATDDREQIRLYIEEHPSTGSEMTRVDAAVIFDGEIRVVVEVEESNLRPVNLCGKVLATAVSHVYKGQRGEFPLSNAMLFLHVFEKQSDDEHWSKLSQCRCLLQEIPRVMPHPASRIARYSFHYGTADEYRTDSHRDALLAEITSFLCPEQRAQAT